MKINWGTGIVIAFAAFIAFILYFVVFASTQDRAEHSLVTEDYYESELGYQKEIDAEQNAKNLAHPLIIEKTDDGLKIEFPKDQNSKEIFGTVFLYRPSNKQLDFELPISPSVIDLLIHKERLLEGRWNIKVFWECDGVNYLHKENITY